MQKIMTVGPHKIGPADLITSRLGQAVGLMFSRQRDLIFVLPRERTLIMHMLFVFYPIDVVLLDNRQEIVELKPGFRPFSFYRLRRKARYILELKNSTIEKHGLKLGDKISLEKAG